MPGSGLRLVFAHLNSQPDGTWRAAGSGRFPSFGKFRHPANRGRFFSLANSVDAKSKRKELFNSLRTSQFMRMRGKAALFYSTEVLALLGVSALLYLLLPGSKSGLIAVVALIVFAIFGVAQFVVLVCPHCGALAILSDKNTWSISVGSRCRHCHRDY